MHSLFANFLFDDYKLNSESSENFSQKIALSNNHFRRVVYLSGLLFVDM